MFYFSSSAFKCNHRYDEVNINKIASVFGLNEICLKSAKIFVVSQKMNQQGLVSSGDTGGPMFGGPIENVTVSGEWDLVGGFHDGGNEDDGGVV